MSKIAKMTLQLREIHRNSERIKNKNNESCNTIYSDFCRHEMITIAWQRIQKAYGLETRGKKYN